MLMAAAVLFRCGSLRLGAEPGGVVSLSLEASAPPAGELRHVPPPFKDLGAIAGLVPAGVLRGEPVGQISERVAAPEEQIKSDCWSSRGLSPHGHLPVLDRNQGEVSRADPLNADLIIPSIGRFPDDLLHCQGWTGSRTVTRDGPNLAWPVSR